MLGFLLLNSNTETWWKAVWCIAVSAIVLIVGCREQPTTVEGLVTLDGKPLAMHQGMRGTVVFQPTANEGTTLSGLIDANGRYELTAGGSYAVPATAYWVTVSAMEIVPPSEEQPQSTGRLITPAKYASATDSGFRIEVQPGPNQVNLAMKSEVDAPTSADETAMPQTELTETDDEKPTASEATLRE